jgi:hypothetical protein
MNRLSIVAGLDEIKHIVARYVQSTGRFDFEQLADELPRYLFSNQWLLTKLRSTARCFCATAGPVGQDSTRSPRVSEPKFFGIPRAESAGAAKSLSF